MSIAIALGMGIAIYRITMVEYISDGDKLMLTEIVNALDIDLQDAYDLVVRLRASCEIRS